MSVPYTQNPRQRKRRQIEAVRTEISYITCRQKKNEDFLTVYLFICIFLYSNVQKDE